MWFEHKIDSCVEEYMYGSLGWYRGELKDDCVVCVRIWWFRFCCFWSQVAYWKREERIILK